MSEIKLKYCDQTFNPNTGVERTIWTVLIDGIEMDSKLVHKEDQRNRTTTLRYDGVDFFHEPKRISERDLSRFLSEHLKGQTNDNTH